MNLNDAWPSITAKDIEAVERLMKRRPVVHSVTNDAILVELCRRVLALEDQLRGDGK